MIYSDIILEGDPSRTDQGAPPVLPDEYMREDLSCIPRIPLPNGRFVFYMRGPIAVIERLLSDPRVQPQIIAKSWTDLFFGNYQYWDWVFDLDISEQRGGEVYRTRRKLAEVSDQEIHGIYVPCIFAGDAVPDFRLPEFIVEKYQRLRSDTQIIIPTLSSIHDALLERLRRNPFELHNIRPRQFEELICELLARLGWDVELTPESKDGGYDIIGFSGNTGGIKTSWIIECKKYAPHRKVGVGVVRALCGVKEQIKVANAMIVTTSTFTRGAQQLSNSRWDLSLRDYQNVLEWASSNSRA
jgi:HJR/Mrr/RecB family endonuclease